MNRFHNFDILLAWYGEYLPVNGYLPRTIEDYLFETSFFRRWVEKNTDLADIDDLSAQILNGYVSALYDRNLAQKTIHHKLASLINFFGAAYRENKLYADFRGHIHLPRLARTLPAGVLTESETGRIFDFFEAASVDLKVRTLTDAVLLRDHAVMEVLYATGIRRNELAGLMIADVDYENGLLFIRRGKGGKDRVVPIGEKGLQAVRRYIADARSMFVLAGVNCDCLFITRRGEGMGVETVRQSVINAAKGACLNHHVKVHAMRHTCATHLLNNGADIRYVQELLGHTSLSSTQIYTHVSINKLKETHRKYHPRELDNLIRENPPSSGNHSEANAEGEPGHERRPRSDPGIS